MLNKTKTETLVETQKKKVVEKLLSSDFKNLRDLADFLSNQAESVRSKTQSVSLSSMRLAGKRKKQEKTIGDQPENEGSMAELA